MYFSKKRFSKLLLLTVRPAAAVVLAVTLFSQDSRTREDANAIAVRIIIVNSAGEAQTLLDRLKTGDDFGVLAQEKSVDPTANDGGFMGKLDPATLRAELRDALRGVEPGQVSRIVKIPAGYAILKVLPNAEAVDLENADRSRQAAISAAGSVRYAPDVDGWAEAQSFLTRVPLPDDWGQDLHSICESYGQSFSKAMGVLENFLDPMNKESQLRVKNAAPIDVMQAYVAKGQLHAFQGEMARAIDEWEAAYRIALSDVPLAAPRMQEMLGIGYLHKSEMENGVYENPGERCLFPMRPGVRYARTASSRKPSSIS